MDKLQDHCYICDNFISFLKKCDFADNFCPSCRLRLHAAAEIVKKFKEANERWLKMLQPDLKIKVDSIVVKDCESENDLFCNEDLMSDEDVIPAATNQDYHNATGNREKTAFAGRVHSERHSQQDAKSQNEEQKIRRYRVKNRYVCHYCQQTFTNKYILTNHIRPCSVKFNPYDKANTLEYKVRDKYICNCCQEYFSNKAVLDKHVRECCKDKPYRDAVRIINQTGYICDYCKKEFRTKPHLLGHILRCSVKPITVEKIHPKPHICDICSKGYRFKYDLTNHMRETHKSLEPLSCRFCSETFYKDWRRRRHEFQHLNTYRFNCIVKNCSYKANTLQEMKSHAAFKHSHYLDEQEVKNLFKQVPIEELRAREEELLKRFMCQKCGERFSSIKILDTHIASDCKTRNSYQSIRLSVQCDKCNRFFSSLLHLEKHKERQCLSYKKAKAMKRYLKCPRCDRVFSSQIMLDKHLPIHDRTIASRDHQCLQCVNAYTSAYALKQHVLRTHLKVPSYICRYCSKGFSQAGARRQHERYLHTFERPWKCLICKAGFIATKEIKRHIGFRHGIKDEEEQKKFALKVPE